jgi:glycine/D-amino acid oxidase-like deaminating enzyme
MKYTDIAIIGGGLAGSTAAAMLGRAGIPTILIDPHQVYPFDFRVEKSAATSCSGASARPESPIRCFARPPMTAKTGSRDSATSSTRSRAANTASCTTR